MAISVVRDIPVARLLLSQYRSAVKPILAILAFVISFGTLRSAPRMVSLLAPTRQVSAKSQITIKLVSFNPNTDEMRVEPEDRLAVRLLAGTKEWNLELPIETRAAVVIPAGGFVYSTYALTVPADIAGLVVVEVDHPSKARTVIDVGVTPPAGPAVEGIVTTSKPPEDESIQGPVISEFRRSFSAHFAEHLPVYFISGTGKPAAKFQFSFKYRLLGDQSALGTELPSLRSIYFGYTQRSLWDITSSSSPFYDTSYMPELILESLAARAPAGPLGFQWLGFQTSAQHESNGRDGPASRSLNIAYVRPMFSFGDPNRTFVLFAPKLFAYLGNLSDNPDLKRYRGYGEYTLVVGYRDSLSLGVTGRVGDRFDRGSIQLDLTIPLRARFGDFASYLLIQYFDGYGESLLHYNEKASSLRGGFSFVR